MANCTICNKPIVLIPSAEHRAERFGGKPSDYTKLFTTHNHCAMVRYRDEVVSLIERRKYDQVLRRDRQPGDA